MLNILLTLGIIVLVIFFLGLCIFIHELAHLLVAKWRGLYVEKFSIGFGKKIWGFWYKNIEFVVSWLPFGGYVALPQMETTEEARDRDGNKLPEAGTCDRILTAAAGPISNVLFGFALGVIVWVVGLNEPVSMEEYVVEDVPQSSPEYQAGLRSGDVITELNGEGVPDSWQDFVRELLLSTERVTVTVERGGELKDITYKPEKNPEFESLPYPFFSIEMPVVAERVMPDKPAAEAGIEPGDRFVKVNGEKVHDPLDFTKKIWNSGGEPISLTVEREGELITFPEVATVESEGDAGKRYMIGVAPGVPQQLVHKNPWRQFVEVMSMTHDTLAALINPESPVGARHLSGPVGILSMNYQMIRYQGWQKGLSFVVLITFNLALINILPVPVLDGGHILFGVIESIIGRRIPPRIAQTVQTVFAALLIAFIIYVTFFDLNRFIKPIFTNEDKNDTSRQEEIQEQGGQNGG